MTKRIQALAEQAFKGLETDPLYATAMIYTSKELEKFAELIVRECAKVCDELQKWPSTEPRHCASDIRIHFGVEE